MVKSQPRPKTEPPQIHGMLTSHAQSARLQEHSLNLEYISPERMRTNQMRKYNLTSVRIAEYHERKWEKFAKKQQK